ncbi:DUF4178 domain-containing protein [Chitinophaga sp. GCM10012297]|uniref:DUF4178 domain-containing protein n=1 Tax=Chitinophaga chungangae TaxID=2821488 RepID=A0ABS3Y8G7_9BACT|nr:DUF4178 domain-containing protein [Chitinophaga chungangae]MBO9150790.1 DUF4178 domain-containing protein [Chitinophaga chungangae]
MPDSPHTIVCPDCRHVHESWNADTEYFGCSECASWFQKKDGRFVKLLRNAKATTSPVLEPGETGIIDGQEYRMMGFAQRNEPGQPERWQEYWLKDVLTGKTVWLSEYNGHWLFVQNIPETELTPELKKQLEEDKIAVYQNEDFELFTEYKAVYYHLSGEFPYDPTTEKAVVCREYIAPPLLLALENDQGDKDYSISRYMRPRDMKKAFNLKYYLPIREGVSPAQPFSRWFTSGEVIVTALIFCAIVFIAQYFYASNAMYKEVYSHVVQVNDSTVAKPIVSPSFEITGGVSNLEVSSYAILSNNWVEAAIDLVNEQTGEEKSFATGVEYYHGVDGGESWSEGSMGTKELLCTVEPGRYHMVVNLFKDQSVDGAELNIVLRQDVATWWNALWAMGIMAGFAAIVFAWENNFEKNRWYNSPFTTYTYDE